MGCSQSKTSTDQVVERGSTGPPAVEETAVDSTMATNPEATVEAPPSTEEDPVIEDPAEKVEEPASVEEVVEERTAPVTQEVVAEVEEPAEEVVEQTTAPTEDVAPVEEEDHKTEEKVVLAEEEEKTPVEAPKSDTHVEEADSVPEVEAKVETPESPKVETVIEDSARVSEVTASETPAEEEAASHESSSLTFTAEPVTFNDKGVAYFNFDGSDGSNPANDVHVSKRFSEFKTLHVQLTQILSDNQHTQLPALPKTTFLQGRKNPKMLEDRKTQFTSLLNAIAIHPVASHSDVFKAFLA